MEEEENAPRRAIGGRRNTTNRGGAAGRDASPFKEEVDYDANVEERDLPRRGYRAPMRRDGDISNVKLKIPSFQGANDPDAY